MTNNRRVQAKQNMKAKRIIIIFHRLEEPQENCESSTPWRPFSRKKALYRPRIHLVSPSVIQKAKTPSLATLNKVKKVSDRNFQHFQTE